jgi:hypothetical protein
MVGGTAQGGTVAAQDAQAFVACNVSAEDLLAGLQIKRAVGDVVDLRFGSTFEIDGDTPTQLLHGLLELDSIAARPDGTVAFRFKDGELGLVDLENGRVAFADGTSLDDPRLYGALVAARALRAEEGFVNDPAARELAMSLRMFRETGDPVFLSDCLARGEDALNDLDDLELNAPGLQAKFAKTESTGDAPEFMRPVREINEARFASDDPRALRGPMSNYAVAARETQDAFAEVEEDSENMRQLKGMVFGFDPAKKQPMELHPILAAMGEKAAETLGREIVDRDFIEDLYLNETITQTIGTIFERYTIGQRSHGLLGPGGTGKDTTAKIVAALLGRPLVTLQGGKGVQVQGWMGGERLSPHEVYDTCGKCDTCMKIAGKKQLEEDPETGEVEKTPSAKECPSAKLVAAFNVTAEQEGELAKALQTTSIIHISEVKGMADQFPYLHDALGSGPGEERFFTINSAHGGTKQVDPHCMIFVSWNPEVEDWRLEPATMRRLGLHCFDPLSKDEEAERLAAMSNKWLKQQPSFPEFHENPFTKEDLLPIAEFYQRFMNAVEGDSEDISTPPSPQLFAMFFTDVVVKAANQAFTADEAAATDQAIQWSLTAMEAYLDQNLSKKDRKRKLTKLLGEAEGPLGDIVLNVRKLVAPETAKPVKKPKPAAPAAS